MKRKVTFNMEILFWQLYKPYGGKEKGLSQFFMGIPLNSFSVFLLLILPSLDTRSKTLTWASKWPVGTLPSVILTLYWYVFWPLYPSHYWSLEGMHTLQIVRWLVTWLSIVSNQNKLTLSVRKLNQDTAIVNIIRTTNNHNSIKERSRNEVVVMTPEDINKLVFKAMQEAMRQHPLL